MNRDLLIGKEIYRSLLRHKTWTIVILLGLAIVLFLLDLLSGVSSMTLSEAAGALLRPDLAAVKERTIIWSFRFPAALMAVLVGAALAIAGAEMQTILGNPLASPFTLGTSAAAGFGAALAMTGYALIPLAGFDVSVNAFLCALLCNGLVYFIARFKTGSAEVLILAGIAMMFLFNSAQAVVQYLAAEEELQGIVFWLFGNLARATWPQTAVLSAVLLACIPVLVSDAWKLSALRLGESAARSLGVNVQAVRFRMVLLTSLLTAVAICFVGTIAFIGLIAPHIARLLVGEDQRFLLPCSALTGICLLSAASTISEMVVPSIVFPIGVVTSLLGAPFFIFMVLKFKKELL